jgi:DNA-binding transcriptional ArsR family regulator
MSGAAPEWQRELRNRLCVKRLAEPPLSIPARTEVHQSEVKRSTAHGGERPAGSVTEVITKEFGITQAGVSQHLRALRDGGFVRVRIEGPRRIYSVDSTPLQEIDVWIDQFRGFWDQRLRALTGEIARGKAKQRDPS